MIQQGPQPIRSISHIVLIARHDIGPQDQPQARALVGVIAVRRVAGFMRIVGYLGALLVPVRGLDRAVPMLTGSTFKNLARRPVLQRLVGALVVVERRPFAEAPTRYGHGAERLDINLLAFQVTPQPSNDILSRYRPLPTMLIRTPRSASSPVNAALMSCTP